MHWANWFAPVPNITVLFALLFMARTLLGQEPADLEQPFQQVTLRHVAWDVNGKATMQNVVLIRVNVLDHELLLREPEVQKELDIVNFQADELNRLLEKSNADSQRLLKNWNYAQPQLNEDIQEWRKIREEMTSKLHGILLPHQAERIPQIINRIAMRDTGPLEFFKSNSERLRFRITNEQQKKIETLIQRISDEVKNELGGEVQNSVQSILESLNDNQRKSLDEIKGQLAQLDDVDIFLAQLRYMDTESLDFGIETSAEFDEMLVNCPQYSFTFDGRFCAVKPSQQDPNDVANFIDRLVNEESNLLELTPEQFTEFGDATRKYWEKVMSLQKELAVREEQDGKRTKESNDVFVNGMTSAANSRKESYNNILLPVQKQFVRQLQATQLRARYGLVCCVVCGELGKTIELTDVQRKDIRENANKELSRIERETAPLGA
ncbi:MAG: hypothetical protein R3C03_00630 [Pirellulaceae bacterium]